MTNPSKIAFLGMGTMGLPLAMHLVDDSIDLTVWNRTRAKCDPIAARGAKVADQPGQAVAGAAYVFSMVTDDDASRAVWLGKDGALAGIEPGSIIVEMSTLSPDWSCQLAAMAAERDARYLESPVAGGPQAAADASAMLLVGGDADTLEQASDLLLRMAAKTIHIGPTGTATALKLARNLLLGIEIAGLAEVVRLALSAGVDKTVLIRSIVEGPTASPVIKGIIEPMVHGTGGNAFAIDILCKDVGYGLREGARHNSPLPVSQAVRTLLAEAEEMGMGGEDVSALAHVIANQQKTTGKNKS